MGPFTKCRPSQLVGPSHRLAIEFLRGKAHVPGFIRSIGREAKELPVDLRPRPERQEMCGWQFFWQHEFISAVVLQI